METGWCWPLIEKITRMQQFNFNQEDRRIAITTKQGCDKIKWAFAYGKLVNLSFCVDLIPPLFPPEGSNIDFTGHCMAGRTEDSLFRQSNQWTRSSVLQV